MADGKNKYGVYPLNVWTASIHESCVTIDRSFEDLLTTLLPGSREVDEISSLIKAFEDQCARFKSWAANLDPSEEGPESIDSRLDITTDGRQKKDLLCKVLQELYSYLVSCTYHQVHSPHQCSHAPSATYDLSRSSRSQGHEHTPDEGKSAASKAIAVSTYIHNIGLSIDDLYTLSPELRKAAHSKDEARKLYVHYTISEDRSGSKDEQMSRILAPLARKSEGFDFRAFGQKPHTNAQNNRTRPAFGPLAEKPQPDFDPRVSGADLQRDTSGERKRQTVSPLTRRPPSAFDRQLPETTQREGSSGEKLSRLIARMADIPAQTTDPTDSRHRFSHPFADP
jgi:hypothetical protein